MVAAVARTTQLPVPVYVICPIVASTLHVVVVLLTLEYVIGAPPRADAEAEGVKGDCTVVTAVVGDHVTICVAFDTVNVTSLVPSRYSDVEAAVALTVQSPVPVYVSTPVAATTEQVLVVNPAITE